MLKVDQAAVTTRAALARAPALERLSSAHAPSQQERSPARFPASLRRRCTSRYLPWALRDSLRRRLCLPLASSSWLGTARVDGWQEATTPRRLIYLLHLVLSVAFELACLYLRGVLPDWNYVSVAPWMRCLELGWGTPCLLLLMLTVLLSPSSGMSRHLVAHPCQIFAAALVLGSDPFVRSRARAPWATVQLALHVPLQAT